MEHSRGPDEERRDEGDRWFLTRNFGAGYSWRTVGVAVHHDLHDAVDARCGEGP